MSSDTPPKTTIIEEGSREIRRALELAVHDLSAPASWTLRHRLDRHVKSAEKTLEKALADAGKKLSDVHTSEERAELIAPIIRDLINPYRNWFTLRAATIGGGGAAMIGLTMLLLPQAVTATVSVALGLIAGELMKPFLQRVCAPISRLSGADPEVVANDTPYHRELERIAMRKTALLKTTAFEGRNIRSECYVQTMLSLSMVKQIPDDPIAAEALALVLLNFAMMFREVYIDDTWASLSQRMMGTRFATPEAYAAVRSVLWREAKKAELDPAVLDTLHARLVGPMKAAA